MSTKDQIEVWAGPSVCFVFNREDKEIAFACLMAVVGKGKEVLDLRYAMSGPGTFEDGNGDRIEGTIIVGANTPDPLDPECKLLCACRGLTADDIKDALAEASGKEPVTITLPPETFH